MTVSTVEYQGAQLAYGGTFQPVGDFRTKEQEATYEQPDLAHRRSRYCSFDTRILWPPVIWLKVRKFRTREDQRRLPWPFVSVAAMSTTNPFRSSWAARLTLSIVLSVPSIHLRHPVRTAGSRSWVTAWRKTARFTVATIARKPRECRVCVIGLVSWGHQPPTFEIRHRFFARGYVFRRIISRERPSAA